jgi:hypothetical protein
VVCPEATGLAKSATHAINNKATLLVIVLGPFKYGVAKEFFLNPKAKESFLNPN